MLSEINVAGGGVKFANGGVVGSRISGIQKALKSEVKNIELSPESVDKIAEAVYTGSQNGISDLSDNRNIIQGVNF